MTRLNFSCCKQDTNRLKTQVITVMKNGYRYDTRFGCGCEGESYVC